MTGTHALIFNYHLHLFLSSFSDVLSGEGERERKKEEEEGKEGEREGEKGEGWGRERGREKELGIKFKLQKIRNLVPERPQLVFNTVQIKISLVSQITI